MSKIGINGFGRVGRCILRAAVQRKIQITAINDPGMTAKVMEYLIKYDTCHGRFPGTVKAISDDALEVNGQKIAVSFAKCPEGIPWKHLGVEFVAETSGKYMKLEELCPHIKQGAKVVVLSAPGKDLPMFVRGLNMQYANAECPIMSFGSCTINALAPLVKVLHENFCLTEGFMTTIHSVVAQQQILDKLNSRHWRLGRSGTQNSMPYATGAAEAVGCLIEGLEEKLAGMGFFVPIINVSAIDLTVRLKQNTNIECISKRMQEASEKELKGVLGYTEDQVVSSDFMTTTESSIFDAKASIALNENFFKIIAWYDNEYASASRILDLLEQVSKGGDAKGKDGDKAKDDAKGKEDAKAKAGEQKGKGECKAMGDAKGKKDDGKKDDGKKDDGKKDDGKKDDGKKDDGKKAPEPKKAAQPKQDPKAKGDAKADSVCKDAGKKDAKPKQDAKAKTDVCKGEKPKEDAKAKADVCKGEEKKDAKAKEDPKAKSDSVCKDKAKKDEKPKADVCKAEKPKEDAKAKADVCKGEVKKDEKPKADSACKDEVRNVCNKDDKQDACACAAAVKAKADDVCKDEGKKDAKPKADDPCKDEGKKDTKPKQDECGK